MITFFRANEPHLEFVEATKRAIEQQDRAGRRANSRYYKPSSLGAGCDRMLYFMRNGDKSDGQASEYTLIGMCASGSSRHETLQKVFEAMPKLGFDWEYIDVAEYLERKHTEGKCLSTLVVGKSGMETKLKDELLGLSFLADGVVRKISTGEMFLLEIKTQISHKWAHKAQVDREHVAQVTAYCLELDLEKAIVLYENRDTCELCCPELLTVTDEMKQALIDRLRNIEQHVKDQKIPPMADDIKACKWCPYKTLCKNVGTVSDMPPV